MQSTGQSTKRSLRGLISRPILAPLIFGFLGFMRFWGDPHYDTISTVDMIRLIAVGFILGIAFAWLLWLIKFRKS